MKLAALVAVGLSGAITSIAGARDAGAGGMTARLGLTGAVEDQGAKGRDEGGPMVAVGWREGPFVAEVEWAYLSFFDVDTVGSGVQRLGVVLRADVIRRYATHCLFRFGCTRGSSLWVEAGAGERFGQWVLDAHDIAPARGREPEAHLGVGIELDNQLRPMRNGWQLGVRFAVAPRGFGDDTACRTTGGSCSNSEMPTTAADKGGYDGSVLLEWMFLFGS